MEEIWEGPAHPAVSTEVFKRISVIYAQKEGCKWMGACLIKQKGW